MAACNGTVPTCLRDVRAELAAVKASCDRVDWLSSCERITQRMHEAVEDKLCDAFPSGVAWKSHACTLARGEGGTAAGMLAAGLPILFLSSFS